MIKALREYFIDEEQMLLAVLANALIIFLMYFPEIKAHFPHFYATLDFLDHFYAFLFVIEAIVRIRHYGPKVYFSNTWFLIDFAVTIISIPGLLNYIGFPLVPDTSIVQLLRLFRLARLIRFLRFVPNISMLMAGLVRALKASVFVFITLLILNFILALFACHFFGEVVPEYFANPLISSYYIFQMFTVEGWNEIPILIAQNAETKFPEQATQIIILARLFFIFVVLTGGIFGMSLANAIFVDEMTMDNNRKLETKIDKLNLEISELKNLIKNQLK